MKLKEKIASLFEEKELSPEEIAENVKEIEGYLPKISKDLLKEYKESTGKNYIRIFKKERKIDQKYPQFNELLAYISPENDLNLRLRRFGHYETGTFKYISKWNENSWEHINDYEKSIGKGDIGKAEISFFKKEIFNLEKKLRSKIRNHKILKPVKQALGKILNKKNKEK